MEEPWLISLISFLLVISICVIAHEGGHYLAALWRGVLIHEFSFGMGPLVYSYKKWGTMWSFRAVPIGGYVKLEGEDSAPGESCPLCDETRSVNAKKPWERFVIIAAGAFVNIVLAWLLTVFLLSGNGVLDLKHPAVGVVVNGTPAREAGILRGDVIKSINGVELKEWSDIGANIRKFDSSEEYRIEVLRNDTVIVKKLRIPVNKEHGRRLLGVQPARVRYPLHTALIEGFSYAWSVGIDILKGLYMLLTRQIKSEVVGPVGIAVMAGDAFKAGFWSFIIFLAIINLHLGILNLLPFPALDGGRLIFIELEMITGRKVPDKWEAMIHYGGFLVLLFLIALITFKDILRLFNSGG